MPLAYFITFTTYGTWLHGTEKGFGSVDRLNNQVGMPFLPPNQMQEQRRKQAMTQPAYYLDEPRRDIVRDAIVEICRERNWKLWAVHVRTNHVHTVVSACADAERQMMELKARASRNLTLAGFDSVERKRWTRHGSTLYLFDEGAVASTVHYTLYGQGETLAVYDGKFGKG